MRGEKSAPMFPEQRPDDVAIRLWNVHRRKLVTREEAESSFAMFGRAFAQTQFYFKEKDEPMAGATVGVFTHDGRKMQIAGGDFQSKLLIRFPTGTSVRRLAYIGVNLATTRAPEATIRFVRAFEQQDFVALVEHVKQRGNSVGQLHSRN